MRFFRILFFLFLPFLGLQAQNIPVFEINDPAINKKGKIFFKSTDGFTFSGDLAPVALKDISGQTQIGFINKGGKLVVPAQFDGLGDFSQGYYEVRKNGKYGLINAAGQTVEDYQYKGLKFQDNEHILATHFISWQIKDNFNKVIEKVEADSIVAISDSAYKIFLNGQIFPLRQQKKRPASAALAEELSKKESFPYTTWFYKGKIAYENLECNLVVPPVYDSVKYVPEERIFMVYWKDKIGILEYDGTEIMPLTNKYKKIYSFVNGRARMLRDGRYGFIDRYANVRVAPQYENVQDFSEGYAAVFLAGKWGFVDQNEKLVVQPFYSEVKPFTFGTARVKEKNRWSFVNPSGEKITSTPYDEIF
ncbi:MAG: WG repeat-containing protein, partial [Cytophagaceae bacterium]